MIINILEFARSKQSIKEDIDIQKLNRAKDVLESLTGKLTFEISGDVSDKPVLKVSIYGKISTLCQNCLEPTEVVIDHNGIVPIFNNESELDEALFGETAESPDGIIADEQFNVLEFIEDEIIMLLPLAPKHKKCKPITYSDPGNNPFGELKKLIN